MKQFEVPQAINYPLHMVGYLDDALQPPPKYDGPVRRMDAREIIRDYVDRNPHKFMVRPYKAQVEKVGLDPFLEANIGASSQGETP